MQQEIQKAVQTFVAGVEQVVNVAVQQRLAALASHLGVPNVKRGPGRPPKLSLVPMPPVALARKPHPVQLCPVPSCKNKAAPSLGMVCIEHKDKDPKFIARCRKGRRFARKNNLKFEEVMRHWEKYRRRINAESN